MDIEELQEELRRFAHERDWEQFHTPKNLAMALAGEIGELLALLQWKTPQESASIMNDPEESAAIRDEMADVFSYLLRLADVLDIDLPSAVNAKIQENQSRYPVSKSRGNALKYSAIREE
ncbi:nucleotide pyrophosphohydrolase [Spirillospora sp. CA-128828]|uniref:nucleotide pyrophosphohydrolase n=1 Tax=Spirillospora sp. CA-128828 TaxID=3240033 RepID=UPI003D9122EA